MKVDIDKETSPINKWILNPIHKQIKQDALDHDIDENHIVNFKLGEPINETNIQKYKDNLPVIKKKNYAK